MTWSKNWDRCNLDSESDLIIFSGHYSLKEARAIIEEDAYDIPEDWGKPENLYVKFGFHNFEGENVNGFREYDEYKKGRIKATRLKRV